MDKMSESEKRSVELVREVEIDGLLTEIGVHVRIQRMYTHKKLKKTLTFLIEEFLLIEMYTPYMGRNMEQKEAMWLQADIRVLRIGGGGRNERLERKASKGREGN